MRKVSVALLAMALCGCSAAPAIHTAGNANTAEPQANTTAPSDSGDCLFGANSANVEVGIANPTQSCSAWVQDLAGSGLAWYPISSLAVPGSQSDGETMQEACDLTANSGEELYVLDSGGMAYGDSICSSEEQNGWTPEGAPGPLAAQGQGQAQSAAAASASAAASQAAAQASAASAQAQASAAAQVQNDDATLNDDVAALNKDYSSWSADVATANSDYQKVKAEPLCSNGYSDQQTYSDAANVYSDGATVYSDESNLSGDINNVNGDITSLRNAESAAGDYSDNPDITTAQAAVSKAQAAVNANDSNTIQSEATAVQTATGNCS